MDCLFQSETGFDVDFSRRVFLTLIFCFSQKINRYVMDGARREEMGGGGGGLYQ